MVERGQRSLYLDYLFLADESEVAVNKYINDGEMFSIYYRNDIVGVVLYVFHAQEVVELKNIALTPEYQGSGIGSLVLTDAFERYKRNGMIKIIVGTANSSIGNLALYQKAGFRISEIKKDFFKEYPTPIYEYGIRALDMVMLEKELIE
ncbi:GNAT family N-acetyltransferase [Salipaludibacillus neizhouensis]|uniref:GNAT family N-acetyltransferase n=2 Tax=Salipaludibacillus neizhouensis TaxID=885475 RepID=A0A3A9KJ92_9BACI|nr:GNAT family N-acetyltransferase [Salipaludibacillus neizhouensis]